MGAAYFYMLTESTVAQTLLTLIGRAQGQGWQIELRGVDPGRMEALDLALWLGPDDSFLPHGLAGGAQDAAQPVLLTVSAAQAGDSLSRDSLSRDSLTRACLMTVDGAAVAPAEVVAAQRVCILFDGQDDAALAGARAQWKDLTAAGCAAQYWAQEAGRWVMKAQAGS